jgi:hypothetical protein
VVETVTELAVRIADLVEAEGRQARHIVVRVGIALAGVLVAGVLALAALVLLLAGIYGWLAEPLGEPGALFVTGLITLAAAGGLVWAAMKLAK